MQTRKIEIVAAAMAGVALLTWAAIMPAQALTAQECSAKYQAAKAAGTLNGQGWNDFRKAQCGAEAAAGDTKAAEPKASEADKPADQAEAKSDAKSAAKGKAKASEPAAAPAGPATFPTAIDAKFAKEKPFRARQLTCAEQWKANKAANTTGGLRWIQKGGGYWSECNKRLKG